MKQMSNRFKISLLDVVFIIILAVSMQFVVRSNSIFGYIEFAISYVIFIDYWFETNTSKGKDKRAEYELFLDFGVMILIFTTIYFSILESYVFYLSFAFFFIVDGISTYIEYKVMKEPVWVKWKKMWVTNDAVMCVVLSVFSFLVQEKIVSNTISFIAVVGLYAFLRVYVAYKTKIKFTYIN